jgi:hypothetical protein
MPQPKCDNCGRKLPSAIARAGGSLCSEECYQDWARKHPVRPAPN